MLTETNHIERVVLAFRGDVDGSFKGAHLERFQIITRDGVEIVRQPGRATTISEAAAQGFTWPEVVAEINAGLVITAEAQAAQITALGEEKQAALVGLASAEAQVQQLQAQLLEYQTPVDENGVPREVTMRQAQLALLRAGLLDAVENAIAAIPGDAGRAAQITWSKSSAVQRDNPLISQLAGVLGLTSQQIDALFVAAAAL